MSCYPRAAIVNTSDCDAVIIQSIEFLFGSCPVEEYDIFEDSITLRLRMSHDETSIFKQIKMVLSDGSKSQYAQIDRKPKWTDDGLLEIHTTYEPWKRFSFEGLEKY